MERDMRDMDMMERLIYGPKHWANLCMVAANILVFLVTSILGLDTVQMVQYGAAYTPAVIDGEYYRLFTCMFLHFDLSHLVSNMVMLLFLGDYLERFAGRARYLTIYLLGGLGGGILSTAMELRSGEMAVSAGASGAVFAVLGGILALLAVHRGKLADLTIQRVALMAVLSVAYGFSGYGINNEAHIGGLVTGFAVTLILCRRNGVNEQEAG